MDLSEFTEIPNFSNYLISRDGRIYSKRYKRLLRPANDKDGYKRVTLVAEGKPHYIRVHRAVAETYIPNPLNKPVVNHLNGNVADNRVENLEWATVQENAIHAIRTGLSGAYGEENHNAKLTKSQVDKIRELYREGCKIFEIRNYFNNIVTWEMIKNIVTYRNWK